MNKCIIKIGLTPSNAPFRISNLRTFIYAYGILLNHYNNGNNCKLIFQIEDTNPNKRLHTDNQIIDFYRKIGILNDNINIEYTKQKDNTDLCEYYYHTLLNQGYIIVADNGVGYFNIKKYINKFGQYINISDLIKSNVVFDANNLTENDMFAIKRSDGSYLYHFASCIDNISLGLTHIIRGNNKLMSSAFQTMICRSLNIKIPKFIHLPLLLEKNEDHRRNVYELLNEGYDFQPLASYLISSGYGDSNMIYYSYNDFAKNLDISKFHIKDGNFDQNILRKNSIRYFNNVSYDDYCNNIVTTAILRNEEVPLNLLPIFYEDKLSYSQIKKHLSLLNSSEYESISCEEKKIVDKIIPLLENHLSIPEITNTLNTISSKNIYEMIQWIFTGHKLGTSCNVLMNIYNSDYKRNVLLKKERKRNEKNTNGSM